MRRLSAGLAALSAVAFAVVCSNPSRPSPGTGSPAAAAFTGTYELRIETSCQAVPPEERVRTYLATVTGSPTATITLSGGTFWQHPDGGLKNVMIGIVSTTGVNLYPSSLGGFGTVERVDADRYLELQGSGSGQFAGGGRGVAGARQSVTGSLSVTVRFGGHLRDQTRHASCAANAATTTFSFTPTDAPPPPVGIAASVISVSLTGPGEIPPDASAQFAAIGRLSDGSTRDVSAEASWRTSAATILSVSAEGLASGRARGQATITAVVPRPHLNSTVSSGRTVLVLPAGTFRLAGRVTEAGEPTVGIGGALVKVEAGPAEGLFATTGSDGGFALFGVVGPTRLGISRDGYAPQVVELPVLGHQTLDVALPLVGPRLRIDGAHTVRITAAPSCAGTPLGGLTRTYSAVITQTGPRLAVELGDADFLFGRLNRFGGNVDADRVILSLLESDVSYYYYYQYPAVVERLSATLLIVHGRAMLERSGGGFAGELNGDLQLAELVSATRLRTTASCRAANHRLELTPR